MSVHKRHQLQSRGVDIDRLHEHSLKLKRKSQPYQQAHRARAKRLREGTELAESTTEQNLYDKSTYYEALSLGFIDGSTSGFNVDCRDGLSSAIKAGFDMFRFTIKPNPMETFRFNIASTEFTEAQNHVYAFCDISHVAAQFTHLADYENPTNYIPIASRVVGAMATEYQKKMKCIRHGQEKNNGYDVGTCYAELLTTLLDTEL